jgi:hypothetical protein
MCQRTQVQNKIHHPRCCIYMIAPFPVTPHTVLLSLPHLMHCCYPHIATCTALTLISPIALLLSSPHLMHLLHAARATLIVLVHRGRHVCVYIYHKCKMDSIVLYRRDLKWFSHFPFHVLCIDHRVSVHRHRANVSYT